MNVHHETKRHQNLRSVIVAVVLIPLLWMLPGCGTTDPMVVKGAAVAYYYTARGALIYVEDLMDVPERRLHKLRDDKNDSPFNNLMSQCTTLPDPERESGLDVMHGRNGIPATAIYIDRTRILAYEDLRGLASREITALRAGGQAAACKPGCFCPPCPNPPIGFNCCCPIRCR